MNAKARVLIVIVLLLLAMILQTQPAATQEETFPLAEPGPFGVGVRTMTFVDEGREGVQRGQEHRELVTEIWYPAIIPEGKEQTGKALRDARPDASDAPYPLIVYSHLWGGDRRGASHYTEHLASHGFVVAAIGHPDTDRWEPMLINRPLDILFVLDQLAALTEGDLAGVIDTNAVGVIGLDIGAYTALSGTGAQIDPAYYLDWCADEDKRWSTTCSPAFYWEAIVAYRAQFEPPLTEGELWPPTTDERIRGAVLQEHCLGPLFGERGLAAVTTPTLVMAGTKDASCDYEFNAVFTYAHLGAKDRYLLSFIGDTGAIFQRPSATVNHFAVAFFGYYLQEREDYAEYLTEEYVEQFEDLAWGVYEE